MIWTIEVTLKIQNDDWILLPKKGLSQKQRNNISKHFHIMTKKEMKQYYDGWVNFNKYYFNLWD